jgi:radical SAM protein with 4Fe4S-binding SPASM domain
MQGIGAAREVGLPLQINTTMTRHNFSDLEALAEKMRELGITLWSVFFLVPTGRGKREDELSPEECETVFHFLYDLSKHAPFDIKTTAAPAYRRVVVQRRAAERREGLLDISEGKPFYQPGFAVGGEIGRAARGVNDGDGFIFISHTGEIFPSGFLPISAGNVRRTSLVDAYRHSPLFTSLRDPDRLKGKCGVCEFRRICGGSRARAYAVEGDYLASDPLCVYQPGGGNQQRRRP